MRPEDILLWGLKTCGYESSETISPFNVVLISLLKKCNFKQLQCGFFMRTFIPTFFVGRYHTSCLSTDEQVFLFPTILVAQVLVGAMGNTPPIWVHDVGDISAVILSCWILYICAWGPDRDFAPLRKDYTPSLLRFLGSCLHYSLRTLSLHPITTQKHGICSFLFWVLHRAEEFNRVRERGEWMNDIWIGLRS